MSEPRPGHSGCAAAVMSHHTSRVLTLGGEAGVLEGCFEGGGVTVPVLVFVPATQRVEVGDDEAAVGVQLQQGDQLVEQAPQVTSGIALPEGGQAHRVEEQGILDVTEITVDGQQDLGGHRGEEAGGRLLVRGRRAQVVVGGAQCGPAAQGSDLGLPVPLRPEHRGGERAERVGAGAGGQGDAADRGHADESTGGVWRWSS
jgi:hypothetical protein